MRMVLDNSYMLCIEFMVPEKHHHKKHHHKDTTTTPSHKQKTPPPKHSVGMTGPDIKNLCTSLHVCKKVVVVTTVFNVRLSSIFFCELTFGARV